MLLGIKSRKKDLARGSFRFRIWTLWSALHQRFAFPLWQGRTRSPQLAVMTGADLPSLGAWKYDMVLSVVQSCMSPNSWPRGNAFSTGALKSLKDLSEGSGSFIGCRSSCRTRKQSTQSNNIQRAVLDAMGALPWSHSFTCLMSLHVRKDFQKNPSLFLISSSLSSLLPI